MSENDERVPDWFKGAALEASRRPTEADNALVWSLKSLMWHANMTQKEVHPGVWVPARPQNGKKGTARFWDRLRAAWLVFQCRAEAFIWPEGQ